LLNNTPESGFSRLSQITPGTPVYDSAGEKVGTAIDQSVQGGYLVVQKGLLFVKDVYIPVSAIAQVDNDGVYLNMLKDDLKRQNWENIPAAPTASTASTTPQTARAAVADVATSPASEDLSVPVREEEMMVGKREEEAGRLRVKRDIVEEQQTASVPLTHEEVTIERVPVEGRTAEVGSEPLTSDTLSEQDITIPLRREEPIVGKRTEVSEEIRIHKRPVTEERQVSETVRKERVNVEGADVYGEAPLEQARDEELRDDTLP
jgi:uncharacterized protein (TIGR02271 family)